MCTRGESITADPPHRASYGPALGAAQKRPVAETEQADKSDDPEPVQAHSCPIKCRSSELSPALIMTNWLSARAVFPTGGAQPREPSRDTGDASRLGHATLGRAAADREPDNPTRGNRHCRTARSGLTRAATKAQWPAHAAHDGRPCCARSCLGRQCRRRGRCHFQTGGAAPSLASAVLGCAERPRTRSGSTVRRRGMLRIRTGATDHASAAPSPFRAHSAARVVARGFVGTPRPISPPRR